MIAQPPAGAPERALLRTKLYTPPLRREQVPRPHLVERLNADIHRHQLTLLSAPAGFGKTTLVSEWARSVGGLSPPIAVAWLSLDEGDNDLTRFLAYLVAALQTVEAHTGQDALGALESPQPPRAETILTALINEVAAVPDGMIVVLDDYHLIESQPIHDALTFLLRHLPPQMHLVLATREDPPLPLARMRARGQLAELRAADLRFTSPEAAEFLNRAMGLNLSEEDISALERRTEGWIAGLQLAAISMRGREDVAGFIKAFTGSHHFVLDYLVEEVLERQSESVQTFLLQTSILNRLTGSLCDALTGRDDGQATLEMLEHANLFIVPLDNVLCWYRYHHLFAELLQQRLETAHPDLVNDLHTRAVIWHEANGNLPEAIHHAFAGDDIKTATRLIEQGALEALERSEFAFIFSSVERLPDAALACSPWLFVYHTWALILTGHIEATVPRLENTDWLLDLVSHDDETRKRTMMGHIAGLKAHLAGWQRDYTLMMDLASQAISYLPRNHWICAYCAMMMGVAFWGSGNLQAAKGAFLEAAAVGQVSGNKRVAVTSAVYLGHALELEGHLEQAMELLQDSFQLAKQDGRELSVAGYLHVEVARILYELNEVDLAGQHLMDGIKLCQRLSDSRVEQLGHCLLARLHLARGDLAKAVHSIRNAERARVAPEAKVDMRGAEYPEVRLWLKQDKLGEVETWLDENDANLDHITHFKTKLTYTMHARALIALGRAHTGGTYLNGALDLLRELLGMAERNGWGGKVIEILALQALAFQAKRDILDAMAALARALALAEREGFVRVFVDEGPPMAHLLREAATRGVGPDYARRLLAAFPAAGAKEAGPSERQVLNSRFVEPLSDRELDVLELLAEGLTNREIASRLFLSLNTVKVHTRNIYGKLDAHSRTQAAARARALGILSSA